MLATLWYMTCYALVLAAWLALFLRLIRQREARTLWFLGLFSGFALVALSISLGASLAASNASGDPYRALNALALLSFPLFLATIPRFFASFEAAPKGALFVRASSVLALTSLALPILTLNPGLSGLFWPVFAPHVLALAGVLVHALLGLRRLAKHALDRNEAEAAWVRFAGPAFILSCLAFPLIISSDLLQLGVSLWGRDLPRFTPLLAAGIGLCYLIAQAPRAEGMGAGQKGSAEALEAGFVALKLSPREREVAVLLLEGLAYKAIAERLFVSPATAKSHVLRIYQKAGVASKLGLLRALERAATGPRAEA